MNEFRIAIREQISSFRKELNVAIRDAMEPARAIVEKLQNLNLDFGALELDFDKIEEKIKEENNIIINYKSVITELGYPPILEVPIEFVEKIVYDYKKHNIEYVAEYIDEIVLDYHNEGYLQKMAHKWENKKLVKNRIHILRNVIKCHNQQMYDASIPTLLPQLEGIIADAFGHTGKFTGYHMKTYLEHLLINNLDKDEFTLNDVLHAYYTGNLLVGFGFGEQITSDVSRNAILHGGDTQYGKQLNSLKLILVFDYLLTVLHDVSEDVIQAAKQEIK